MIFLDTHVVVWLHAGDLERLSSSARKHMETEELLISPVVQLELQYLRETDRVSDDSALILESLSQTIGLAVCDQPFMRVVAESVRQSWTRDPFDRLIVAQAATRNAPLLSSRQTGRFSSTTAAPSGERHGSVGAAGMCAVDVWRRQGYPNKDVMISGTRADSLGAGFRLSTCGLRGTCAQIARGGLNACCSRYR